MFRLRLNHNDYTFYGTDDVSDKIVSQFISKLACGEIIVTQIHAVFPDDEQMENAGLKKDSVYEHSWEESRDISFSIVKPSIKSKPVMFEELLSDHEDDREISSESITSPETNPDHIAAE